MPKRRLSVKIITHIVGYATNMETELKMIKGMAKRFLEEEEHKRRPNEAIEKKT